MQKIVSITTIFLIACVQTFAQAAASNPDFMRSTGKIYVVVGVLAMVFIGIIIFLISLERKIASLEKLE
ncbi:MAG: hypothetical protein RI894_975 [Bacteroidota bacterium]|jgi:hypothetical protein